MAQESQVEHEEIHEANGASYSEIVIESKAQAIGTGRIARPIWKHGRPSQTTY